MSFNIIFKIKTEKRRNTNCKCLKRMCMFAAFACLKIDKEQFAAFIARVTTIFYDGYDDVPK